jgi:hypothetical protein
MFVYHAFGPELWDKYNVKRSGYVMGTFSVDFLSDVGESSLHAKPGPAKPEAYLVTGCQNEILPKTTSLQNHILQILSKIHLANPVKLHFANPSQTTSSLIISSKRFDS